MNRIWYAAKNVTMAIAYACVASVLALLVGAGLQIYLYIVGALFITSAAGTVKDSGFAAGGILFLLGVGLIAGANYLVSHVSAMETLTKYISGGLMILLALLQFGKVRDRYGDGTKYKIIMRILPIVYPALIIVGILFTMFPSLASASAMPFLVCGSAGWIGYTVLVLRATKSNGKAINGRKPKRRTSANNAVETADAATVAKAMRAVAERYSGGVESVGDGVNVYCRTNVAVGDGVITFTIGGELRGVGNITTESELKKVQNSLPNVLSKRQKRIMDTAYIKLSELNPDSDYSINVQIGDITQ